MESVNVTDPIQTKYTPRFGDARPDAPQYVLLKRGFFFRKDALGYTENFSEAGTFTFEDACLRCAADSAMTMASAWDYDAKTYVIPPVGQPPTNASIEKLRLRIGDAERKSVWRLLREVPRGLPVLLGAFDSNGVLIEIQGPMIISQVAALSDKPHYTHWTFASIPVHE